MRANRLMGLISIVLGLIFIVCPVISSEVVSIIVGLSLLYFGILSAFMGATMRNPLNNIIPLASIIIGIIAIIFGFLFIFYIDALSFLVAIQFYIVGFIMIVFGITGLMSKVSQVSSFSSILVLIMGIVAIGLAVFSQTQPAFIAVIIGIVLIIEGVAWLLTD